MLLLLLFDVFMDHHKHFCVFMDYHECGNQLSDRCIPNECLCRSFLIYVNKEISYLRKDFWDRHWVELLVELCIGSREPSKLKCLWHKFSTNSVESCDTSYSSNREEMEVASTKISTKTDKDSFSRAVFRSRLGQKIP